MNAINIQLFNSPDEAPIYRPPQFLAASLTSAVVVKNGTVNGNPTIDLIFEDNAGRQYVALVTYALLDSISKVVDGVLAAQNS